MIKWPEHLPALLLGEAQEIVDPQLRTPMQNGRTFVRRNFTAVPVMFPARWIMSDTQAQLFDIFYQHTLKDGTEWFELPNKTPSGYGMRVSQFLGAYSRRQLSTTHWEYSANMQMYLRDKTDPNDALFPDEIIYQSLFDINMNQDWPAA